MHIEEELRQLSAAALDVPRNVLHRIPISSYFDFKLSRMTVYSAIKVFERFEGTWKYISLLESAMKDPHHLSLINEKS